MPSSRGKVLTWLSRIGGRAHVIAVASLLVLGLQAGLLVYGLDRGFGILTEILASTNRATEAVDALSADLNTVNDSIVEVMAGLLTPADVSEFVIERPAAMAHDWPAIKRRFDAFTDPSTSARADDAMDHMTAFSNRLSESLPHADRAALERLQQDWHDLQDPLLRLVNEVRARIVEQGEAERLGAVNLQREIGIAESIALVVGLCVLGATWYLLIFTIARPVTRIASTMTTMAEGRLDARIPGRRRRDEIGEMAIAVEVFRHHAVERDGLLRERADAASRLERLVEERTAELKQRGAMLDATFDNMAQGILMVDRDMRIVVHNQRFLELWGLTPDVIRTHPTMSALLRYTAERGDFAPANPQDIVVERLTALGKGRNVHREARLNSGVVLEIRGVPLLDGGYVFTYTDVTDQRQAEDEIRVAKEAAEAANNAKSSFLATMTHELRTPMNGVLGILELLHQTDLDSEQRELIDVIGGSAEALLKIIDDILDLSKIEAGKMEIERVPLAPLPLIEGVADTLAPHAHRKKLSFNTYVDQTVPPAIVGDPVRLRQILFNLIGNAIKFTERGSVSVQLTTEGPNLRLNVTDTGIGLDEAARARLFKPFSQADGTTTRRFGGTGLGLSICRRLVELMDGTVGVDSVPGRGSTFWVQLPLEPATPVAAAATEDLNGLRVLIVEDDPVTSWLLTRYLTSAGASVETAPSAEAALHRLDERPPAVDVAVVDLKLPGRDGFEFHLQMMEDPRLMNVKAILLTAYNDPAHRRRALASNFAAYLTKPVRKTTLIHTVAMAAGRVAAPGALERKVVPAHADDTARGSRGRILVAEDHETNRIVITRQLASLGYQVEVVGDGRAALETLQSAGPYDLILTDCYMPEMDGYELARAVRERERVKGQTRLPIVALTAATLRGEAERCFAAGMDDYLPKPVKLAQLDETLRRWVHGEAAAPRAASGATAPTAAGTRPPVFDLDELREVLGTFDDRTRAFMRQFVDATPPLVERIRQAVAARDRQEAQRTGHTAKGAARSVMAAELAELFAALERNASEEDWSAAEARLAEIAPALERARNFVAQVQQPTGT